MQIYEFKDIRIYIKAKINASPKGYQNQLATKCRIHPSYFSRYLRGQVGLTQDHALSLCCEWGLSRQETRFFLLLRDFESAATESLKAHLRKEMDEMIETYHSVGAQVSGRRVAMSGDGVYYSNWHYSVMHILLTVPEFRTENTIAARLQWPAEYVKQALGVLGQLGLVKKNGKQWEVTEKNIHRRNDDSISWQHHRNWRVHTAERCSFPDPAALHFSAVHSMSKSDFLEVKRILGEAIVTVDRRVRPSKEEDVFFLGVDFYRV